MLSYFRSRSLRRAPGRQRLSSPPPPGIALGRLKQASPLPARLTAPCPQRAAWAAPKSGFYFRIIRGPLRS
ncbi:hypothetical protein NDU88_001218 [Pleurodeles waltl]|uniref:Uncharacterized protein n=1 Tax=Pleurodeles waltl TaxID=8319 RepID=A0AAV7THP6_PLEWA|nr:hypothetical protein NDU88_001218 [Pleurodeles waltl]